MKPCARGVDVPEAPFYSICQANLGGRGHRMDSFWGIGTPWVPSVRLWHGSA